MRSEVGFKPKPMVANPGGGAVVALPGPGGHVAILRHSKVRGLEGHMAVILRVVKSLIMGTGRNAEGGDGKLHRASLAPAGGLPGAVGVEIAVLGPEAVVKGILAACLGQEGSRVGLQTAVEQADVGLKQELLEDQT